MRVIEQERNYQGSVLGDRVEIPSRVEYGTLLTVNIILIAWKELKPYKDKLTEYEG